MKTEKTIDLEITTEGGVRMLHDDAFDLAEFGSPETFCVFRASHVEWEAGGWYVDSAATGKRLKSGCATREEALAWEKNYYSPGSEGWPEIELQQAACR